MKHFLHKLCLDTKIPCTIRLLLLSAFLLISAFLPFQCMAQSATLPLATSAETPKVDKAHVLSLPAVTLNGQSLDLAAQSGWKVIYFWSGTCPCVKACEQYSFLPLARKYQDRVSFFAVAAGKFDLDQPRTELATTVAAHRLPFPVLLDPRHEVAEALGAKVTPQTYLLDPQNKVVFSGMPDDSRRYFGDTKQGVSQTYLARALTQALAGKRITKPHTEDAGCIIVW